jgi:hypothetical protein
MATSNVQTFKRCNNAFSSHGNFKRCEKTNATALNDRQSNHSSRRELKMYRDCFGVKSLKIDIDILMAIYVLNLELSYLIIYSFSLTPHTKCQVVV